MNEVTVQGKQYRVGKLNAFKQLAVVKRVLPLLGGFLTPDVVKAAAAREAAPQDTAIGGDVFMQLLGPITQAFASIPDEDCQYIIKTCLSVVEVKEGTVWARMTSSAGELMFADLELSLLLSLCWEVLRDNLTGFFSTARLLQGSEPQAKA